MSRAGRGAWVLAMCMASGVHVLPAQGDTLPTSVALATFDSAWRAVRRSHHDTARVGAPWDRVRDTLRPRAAAVTSREALRGILNEMLSTLGESHHAVIPADDATSSRTEASPDDAGTTGMTLRLLGGEVLVTAVEAGSPAAVAGIKPGWRVDSVGTDATARAVARVASAGLLAPFLAVTLVNARLDGPLAERVRVVLDTPSGRRVLELARAKPVNLTTFAGLPPMVAELAVDRRVTPAGCVGIIQFTVWMPVIAARFDEAVDRVRDCHGVVIDLRGNVGGVVGMAMGISGHFFATPDTLGVMRMRGSTLQLVANPRKSTRDGKRVDPFGGPVAILVDELTASTSEFFAAGMQVRRRARVFGTTSSGQALPAVLMPLPTGDRLMYAIADFKTPDGGRLEGRGVVPDVVVPRTRAGLLAGRDEPLESAMAWLAAAPASR